MAKKHFELKYKLEINWSPDDGAYVVKVPELPGCVTHGDTMDEAYKNAKEAILGYLESLERRRLPIPKPLSEKTFTGKIPLRIDPILHRNLAIRASIEGLSVNKFIESKLKKAV